MKLKVGDKVRPSEDYLEKVPQDAGLTGVVTVIYGFEEGMTLPNFFESLFPVRVLLSNGNEGLAKEHELVLIEDDEVEHVE